MLKIILLSLISMILMIACKDKPYNPNTNNSTGSASHNEKKSGDVGPNGEVRPPAGSTGR
ncbi:MAG TPA: hypothetical protein VI112_09335 [Bacteroidia bacterium]|jgi:hypothetical protein